MRFIISLRGGIVIEEDYKGAYIYFYNFCSLFIVYGFRTGLFSSKERLSAFIEEFHGFAPYIYYDTSLASSCAYIAFCSWLDGWCIGLWTTWGFYIIISEYVLVRYLPF